MREDDNLISLLSSIPILTFDVVESFQKVYFSNIKSSSAKNLRIFGFKFLKSAIKIPDKHPKSCWVGLSQELRTKTRWEFPNYDSSTSSGSKTSTLTIPDEGSCLRHYFQTSAWNINSPPLILSRFPLTYRFESFLGSAGFTFSPGNFWISIFG